MEQIKVLVIGAGGRGRCMTDPMLEMPEKFKVVGVADPEESLVENIRRGDVLALLIDTIFL